MSIIPNILLKARVIIPLLLLIGAGTYVAVNLGVMTQFTQQVLVIANPDGSQPAVVVCNTPLDALLQSTRNGITGNARNVCLGGLVVAGGPPMLGDARGYPVINPVGKFGADIQAAVLNNVLICQIPCSNPNAYEIKTCYDFAKAGQPAPAVYSIRAHELC